MAQIEVQAIKGESMAGVVPAQHEFNHQCFPLFSLLLAMGNPKVNYLSLDIEGAEFQVLRSIPWNLVDIEVITVEFGFFGRIFPGTRNELHTYLSEKDYKYIGTLGGADDIFVTLDMLNGSYYWDRKDLPVEWEDIFSFWDVDDYDY